MSLKNNALNFYYSMKNLVTGMGKLPAEGAESVAETLSAAKSITGNGINYASHTAPVQALAVGVNAPVQAIKGVGKSVIWTLGGHNSLIKSGQSLAKSELGLVKRVGNLLYARPAKAMLGFIKGNPIESALGAAIAVGTVALIGTSSNRGITGRQEAEIDNLQQQILNSRMARSEAMSEFANAEAQANHVAGLQARGVTPASQGIDHVSALKNREAASQENAIGALGRV